MLSNPILWRELVVLLRRRRLAALQCAIAFSFALLVLLRWPTDARMALAGSGSLDVFRTFAFGLLTALLLLLPAFPATSIVRETRSGTLALLLNTPLGPWRIYFGKLLATLGLTGLLLAASLPAAAACFSLGGVSLTGGLLAAYLLLLLTALQFTAISLWVSVVSTSTDAAVRGAYGLVLALSVVLLLPHTLFAGTEGQLATIADWSRCASPYAAMSTLLGAADAGSRGIISHVDVTGRFVLISLASTVLFSVLTIARLNHSIFDRSRAAGAISDDQAAGVQAARRVMFIIDPQRRSGAIGPLTNPVMIKEFRCRKFGRLHWLLRLIAACAVLSLAISILTVTRTIDLDPATVGAVMVVLQVALLVLITPSLAAGLFSTEVETGGWVLLQMTPMSIPRIVRGKLLSVILTLLLVLCATIPGYVVMVYIEPGQRYQIQRVVLSLAFTAVFVLMTSAAIGSLFRRTTAATAAAYAFQLAICGGPLLVWLGRDAPFGHDVVEAALTVNPVAAALTIIRFQGFRDYELLAANWWFLGLTSAASLAVLLWRTWRISRPQ